MKKLIIILSLLALIIGCSDKPVKWVANGTKIEATKYRLAISDTSTSLSNPTSKILLENGDTYSLINPNDNLLVEKYTINYSAVDEKANLYFKTKANQQVRNTLNPKVTEYYQFVDGDVFLLGYSTGDSLKPYTVFEPALVISKHEVDDDVKSSGVMKMFVAENNSFDKGMKTNLTIKNIRQIAITNKNKTNTICNLRELTLSRDATVSYGENNLIMPEAIMFKTTSLLYPNGYPIAEWSVKTENAETTEPTENEPKRELYIELIKYKEIIIERN